MCACVASRKIDVPFQSLSVYACALKYSDLRPAGIDGYICYFFLLAGRRLRDFVWAARVDQANDRLVFIRGFWGNDSSRTSPKTTIAYIYLPIVIVVAAGLQTLLRWEAEESERVGLLARFSKFWLAKIYWACHCCCIRKSVMEHKTFVTNLWGLYCWLLVKSLQM